MLSTFGKLVTIDKNVLVFMVLVRNLFIHDVVLEAFCAAVCMSFIDHTNGNEREHFCQLLEFILFSFGNIRLLLNPINNKTN